MFTKKTIRDVNLKGKTVLLHGEFDAPLNATGSKVTSDFRIAASVPTIQYLQKQDCKIVMISKLGRPDGKVDPKQSLKPVADMLATLLGQEVAFVSDCIGPEVQKAAKALQPRGLLLLENLRFHPEEEKNDLTFAKQIASDSGAELFVQDCFALAHRKEAGTDAITRALPSVAGLHLEKEVTTITRVMTKPDKPLVAIVGGAKIADKIEFLKHFVDMADVVAIGGAMANTFLKARGIPIGKSKFEPGDVALARDILSRAEAKAKKGRFVFYIPEDVVVATSVSAPTSTRIVDWQSQMVADVQSYPKQPPAATGQIRADEMILDMGPLSAMFVAGCMQLAGTVIWNGTMGVTETPAVHGPVGPFAHGTEIIIEAMVGDYGTRPFTLVGGGDTTGYIEQRKLTGAFNHVSAGGGASLELMSGHKLPGVEALQNK